jgi:hypothetical protein
VAVEQLEGALAMPTQVRCASCKKTLRVADNSPFLSVSCPNCLAHVPVRGRQIAARPARRSADAEAARDTRWTRNGLIFLAVLGALGVMGMVAKFGGLSSHLLVALAAGFLVLVSAGIIALRAGENPNAVGIGRVVLGTFALAGFLMLLPVALVVAAVVFFLAACPLL